MKKKSYILIAMLTGLAILLTACSSKNDAGGYEEPAMDEAAMYSRAESAEMEVYDYDMDDMAIEESGYAIEPIYPEEGNITTETISNAKVIMNAGMTVETKDFDQFILDLADLVAAKEGFIQYENINGRRYGYESEMRYAYYTVRIPQEVMKEFMAEMEGIGNVIYKNTSSEDVTLQYTDIEMHKESLKIEQDRLLELLEQAETVEEIITIESRLSEVRYSLESYESRLRVYDNQINYSTISIDVNEVERETDLQGNTIGERIRATFSNSLYQIQQGFLGLVVFLIGGSPYLLILAVCAGAVFLVVRRTRRKKKDNGEDKME